MDIYEQREKALMVIEAYMYDLDKPTEFFKKGVFEQRSYQLWAVRELHDYVRVHEEMAPLEAVSLFADKMDRYSTMSEKTSFRFSVAHDVALNVLDIFLTQF